MPHQGVRRAQMPTFKLKAAQRMRREPTPGEAALWQAIRKKALGWRFRCQAPMWGYIADFYCPKLRLCLEVDGGYHRPEIDNYRDQALANHGITTLRFSNAQVLRGIDAVLAKIKDFANSQRTSKKAQLGALIQPGNLAIAASNATYDAINTP